MDNATDTTDFGHQMQNEEEQDYEWDESNATLTSWAKSKQDKPARARRAYGRRASSTIVTASGSGPTSKPRGYGRQPRSSITDFSSFASVNPPSEGLNTDQPPRPFDRDGRSNSVPVIGDFRPKSVEASDSNDCVVGNENAHPNLNSNDSLPFARNSATAGNCFSSISRSAFGNSSTSKASSSKTFSSSFTESLADSNFPASYLSPSRSVSSSRKRGVCDSPVVHMDDLSSNHSISRHSTSSYGSRRARSRIFSPGSTKKIMEAAAADLKELIPVRQKNEMSFNDESESEDDEHSSSIMLSTSCDTNEDADEIGNPTLLDIGIISEPTPLPLNRLRLRRMSAVENFTFEEAIFAPVEVNPGKDAHSRVFETMSSYEDLKFLIRELRRWNSGKQVMTFGMRMICTVVPPRQWSHERKAGFKSWTTSHLGFYQRSGGGMVSYLQTTKSKGQEALKELEAALLSYKESSKDERSKSVKRSSLRIGAPMSSIKIRSRITTTPLMPCLKSSSITTPMVLGLRSSLPRYEQYCFHMYVVAIFYKSNLAIF